MEKMKMGELYYQSNGWDVVEAWQFCINRRCLSSLRNLSFLLMVDCTNLDGVYSYPLSSFYLYWPPGPLSPTPSGPTLLLLKTWIPTPELFQTIPEFFKDHD